MDKDVLALSALFRSIRNALREWICLIGHGQRRSETRWLPVCALAMALLQIQFVAADVFYLPVVDMSNHSFPERAESARIPAEIVARAGDRSVDQAVNAVRDSATPEESIVPDYPRVAQATDRPAWAPEPGSAPAGFPSPTLQSQALQSAGRQIRVRARDGGELNLRKFNRGNESVWIVNTPIQITLLDDTGPVEFSADRVVVWTDQNVMGLGSLGLSNAPVEIYLEGNIEFRYSGTRGIAERMYYNIARQNGVILEGEVYGETRQSSRTDDFQTPFRLKGDVLQQLSPTQFQANNAAFTTSRMGVPRYWVESDTLSLDTGRTAVIDQFAQGGFGNGVGGGAVDGYSSPRDRSLGASALSQFDQLRVTSENSRLYAGGIPIFRWPSFTTDLARNPSLYLDRISVGSDGVFGHQLLTRWNNFQLLGIVPDQNTKWTTTLDYLSDRGLGFGSDLEYQRDTFFGRPATSGGFIRSWFINDKGLDNLGRDRRAVPLEEDFRGRAHALHRSRTDQGLEVTAEAGWISDRNMQEQYHEEEWDQEKDQETRLEIKQYTPTGSLSLGGNLRLNDFFTQTEGVRLDHYELGRSLLGNRLTYFEHSQVGYARLRPAEAPTNPIDALKWDPLAWEGPAEGLRAISRQEIDMPLQLGAFKVVPYVLGEAGYWQEDLSQNEVSRLLGQAGVRASLPMWRVDPNVRNELFNLNGIAHKLVFESEFLYADASEDYLNLPLYDALDDDAIEAFRRRFLFDSFGLGVGADVPLRFDERTFAFRSGMQRSVTAQSAEVADDLMMLRLGLRQRIQTKRGYPGRERIVDWFTFDVEGSFFPRADRDNFGEQIGPLMYDSKWHVGDRTTVMSDGYFDFFADGLRTASLGLALSRPGRSQYYAGIRSIEGPISSNVLTTSTTYRMSPKWIWSYSSSYDFSDAGNIGQRAQLVRVGESMLVAVGAYYDASRNNLGFRFDIAPRFIRSKLGMIGGRPIAPVGYYGLE